MLLLLGAFLAGILTVLAPCVLPVLPIIIGGSVTGDTRDKRRPFLIAGALAVSLLLFTILLKASTLLIHIPPAAITYVSGGIIIVIGLATLFPLAYATVIGRLGLEHRAQSFLGTGTRNKNTWLGPIIIGAALGPVFSSCSPVYGYILATVLPAHFATAMAYIVAYVLGLALVLLLIGYYGQRLTARLRFASNPNGYFQRGLAILFILVGLLIISGLGTKLQVAVANHSPFKFDNLSAKLLPKSANSATFNSALYNVAPYKAPEFTGIQSWINSNPQTIQSLKGKVVLIDFWTYTCINCIRSLPYVQGWYSQYQKDGLVVIGVEAPEFAYEKLPANVAAAVKQDKLTYPIAIDGDLATWNAYKNQYWPAEYLIDRDGNVRRQHFGEGEYDQTEKAIRGLLAENSQTKLSANFVVPQSQAPAVDRRQTPETYLGGARANAYAGSPELSRTPNKLYHLPSTLDNGQWALAGNWDIADDKIIARSNASLSINVTTKNMYLVAGSPLPSHISVSFDGQPISQAGYGGQDITDSSLTVQMSNIYRLASFPKLTTGTIKLEVPAGTELNTFTFGN